VAKRDLPHEGDPEMLDQYVIGQDSAKKILLSRSITIQAHPHQEKAATDELSKRTSADRPPVRQACCATLARTLNCLVMADATADRGG